MKSIKTIRGLQRAWNARNRRAAKLSKRRYLFDPALSRHLAKLAALQSIAEPLERAREFRRIPSLEFELDGVNEALTPQQRLSLAQQSRARNLRSRITRNGPSLAQLIADVMTMDGGRRMAKEYWIPFVQYLRLLDLDPILRTHSRDPGREVVEYGVRSKRRHLSFPQFANYVSTIRRNWFSKSTRLG